LGSFAFSISAISKLKLQCLAALQSSINQLSDDFDIIYHHGSSEWIDLIHRHKYDVEGSFLILVLNSNCSDLDFGFPSTSTPRGSKEFTKIYVDFVLSQHTEATRLFSMQADTAHIEPILQLSYSNVCPPVGIK
jgi:hypothetical protein